MHPNDEQLIEYVDGGRAAGIRRHLEDGCPECSMRLERIQAMITTMRTDRDADPPAAWVARVVALRARQPVEAVRERLLAWMGGLREELARVISDSCSVPGDLAMAGVRSVGGARRLRFETASVELDLQIEPEVGTAVVTGQFVTVTSDPAPIENAPFLVVAEGEDPIEGTTDRLGEFSVDMPQGLELQLRLRYDDRIVTFDVPPETPPES